MKNIEKNITLEQAREGFFDALRDENATVEDQGKAFSVLVDAVEANVMADMKAAMLEIEAGQADERILVQRGILPALTSEERKYFNEVVKREGFDNVDLVFPVTIIETVFEKLKTDHPILSRVDARSTGGLLKYIFTKGDGPVFNWGPICEDIRQAILKGFQEVDLSASRLSGYVAVCKGALELGPQWLARFVIDQITEGMSVGLESAVISGDGKNKPIGIIKKLSGAADGVYPDKPAVTISDFEPASLAGVRAALAEAKMDTGAVSMIVHPTTYWLKVFPNLAFRTQDGAWIRDRLPTGEDIITSYAMPKDKIAVGDLYNYLLAVASQVKIDRYDQTLAIEDMDLFIAKYFGTGLAKDPNAFFVLDVATVAGATAVELEVYTEPGVPGA